MATKKKLRFEYGKNPDGQWYWHIKAGNREIVAQGEGYKARAGVLKVYGVLVAGMSTAELVWLDK